MGQRSLFLPPSFLRNLVLHEGWKNKLNKNGRMEASAKFSTFCDSCCDNPEQRKSVWTVTDKSYTTNRFVQNIFWQKLPREIVKLRNFSSFAQTKFSISKLPATILQKIYDLSMWKQELHLFPYRRKQISPIFEKMKFFTNSSYEYQAFLTCLLMCLIKYKK